MANGQRDGADGRAGRRALVRAALGGLAGGGLLTGCARPAAAAVAGPFAMAPGWTANWAAHKDPALGAGVTQNANGVTLKAAPYVYSGDEDLLGRSSIVLWSRSRWSGNFKLSFGYTVLDTTTRTTGTGIGAMLYFLASGLGDAQHPASFAAWPSTRPDEKDYTRYGRGLRVTWSNFNTQVPQNSYQIRLRAFALTGDYPEQVGSDSPARFPFPPGVRHTLTFTRTGTLFGVSVRNDQTGVTTGYSWNDKRIGQDSGGYFGIRHQPGRQARYEDFMVSAV